MRAFIVICALLLSTLAFTQTLDTELESRAVDIGHQLRCVVCQNQSIEESDASLAEDMRRQVREMIADGQSDADVRDWFEARYGEFVLFRPKTDGLGAILWVAPFLLLLAGGYAAVSVTRQKSTPDIEAVEPEDV